MGLTIKQQRFVDEYIILGNATQAYKAAGYKAASDTIAASEGLKLLRNPKVAGFLDERLAEIKSEKIANQTEVMEYLTSVMRREHKENVVVTLTKEKSTYEPDMNGTMRKNTTKEEYAEIVEIPAKLSDANKAAELLGKRYGIFREKMEIDGQIPVVITGSDELED